MTRFLYSIGWYLLAPLVVLFMLWRSRKQPAYRRRMRERFGFIKTLTGKPVIWVHAVSMGEVVAAEPLVNALLEKYPDYQILVTSITPTGSEKVISTWSDRVSHCYLAYDMVGSVARFLKRTKPVYGLVMETELWPNLFRQSIDSGTKLMLCSARLSERSQRGYLRIPGPTVIRNTMKCLSVIAAQSDLDRNRFIELGADPDQVRVAGNIKFDLRLPDDIDERETIARSWLGERPIWVAASTHVGEEEQVLAAHRKVLETVPNALLVLVPRHPNRFEEVADLLSTQEWAYERRSSGIKTPTSSQVFLGDSMGEMMSFYSACDVAFVGGSLVGVGGHNLLEPAALGKAVVTGSHLHNFERIAEQLSEAKAVKIIEDADELAAVVANWLANPEQTKQMGVDAKALVGNNRGALARHLSIIENSIITS